MKVLKSAAVAVATMLMSATAAMTAERAIIVLDGSGSMWGQIDGVPKLEIARSALRDVLENAPASLELGLMAYGHREKGNCADIELLVPPRANSGPEIITAADEMKFLGKTPISAAVRQAADALRFTEDKATVILITDGIETCEADPCAIAAELEERGMDFTAHVVGFGLSADEGKQVSCLADATGGRYFPAGNAAELKGALAHVQTVMDLQPVAQEQVEPEPKPQAEADVELEAPEQVTTGAVFDFAWTDTINDSDYITIVPADADAGTVKNHIRVKDNDKGRLTAPGTPGLYELRYVLAEGRRTLASVPVEVVEAEVGLSGPEQVTTGAVFVFAWTGTINDSDYITIVPADADAGTVKNHIRVKDNDKGRLTAPGTPGLYELRYVLAEGRRTLASVPVEVVEAEVGLSGPEQVTTGAVFDFAWTGTINGSDYITIVPADADAGTVKSHIRVKDDDKGRLTAPGTPGLYELRYVLNEDRRTLASVPVEVVEAEVGLSGPGEVTTGAAFDFTWTGTINSSDYVTIVPADVDEGTVKNHIRVKDDDKGRLTAPGTPGLYELRYVLNEDRRTLAAVPVEVVAAEVGITSSGTVRAGTDVDITWSATINGSDFITIVPVGADKGKVEAHIRARDATEGRMKAPEAVGLYEIRYVLAEGRHTLASASLEVVEADAPLDDGAGLDVPATARSGDVITVSWTGVSDSADQRISLARAHQSDFSWIAAHKVGADKTLELKMPAETGTYEVRYLDISGRKVLGRAIVEVK